MHQILCDLRQLSYNKRLTKVNNFLVEVMLTEKLTTALLSGGWVPETFRSFHYWQPVPRWRPLPWLANPGNPAMSPQSRHRHTDKTVEGEGGTGEGKQPLRRAPTLNTLTLMENIDSTQTYYNTLWPKNRWNPHVCADLNAADREDKTCAPLNCI